MHCIVLGLLCLFAVSVAVPPSPKKTFTLTIKNELNTPLFEHTITLDIEKDKNEVNEDMKLIWYLEEAFANDANFDKFTATFGTYGYFIEAINGVLGIWVPDKTYWQILNDNVPLSVGVSTYIPKAGDKIVFQFVVYSGTH